MRGTGATDSRWLDTGEEGIWEGGGEETTSNVEISRKRDSTSTASIGSTAGARELASPNSNPKQG